MWPARRARRWPRFIKGTNWVSRTLTRANSAATKKALSSTSTATASNRKAIDMNWSPILQAHLAEDGLENVLQTHDPRLAAVAAQHDRQAMPAPLHPA